MKKNGYNTNLASEFHVIALLHRLGLEANLTLGNKKSVDIVVVREAGDTVTIDVKAVAGKTDWLVGNALSKEPKGNRFVVLLTYNAKFTDVSTVPQAWVIPHADFLELVKSSNTASKMQYVSRSAVLKLSQYQDAWALISGADTA